MDAIAITDLHKSFDGAAGLRGVTLRVPEGCVYGLVGPGGAGKTALLQLLLGFLRPDRGSIALLGGRSPADARPQVGYLMQGQAAHARFTAREYLRFLGQLRGMGGRALEARAEAALGAAGLGDLGDALIDGLAPQQRQRLGLAQAALAEPALLLLDDPTGGVEPHLAHELLDLLGALRTRGQTVLLATQRLEEAEYLCDRIGVLVGGRLVAEADTRALRGPGRNALISVTEMPEGLAERLRALSPAVTVEGAEVALQPNSPDLQSRVLGELVGAGVGLIALEPFGRPLEDLYLRALRGLPVAAPSADAPPGPPADQAQAEAAAAPAPPGRPGSGDTLLRELLRQEDQRTP